MQGKLCSIGSQAHLKSKHGEGFRLSITTNPNTPVIGDLCDIDVMEELRDVVGDINETELREHICSSASLVYSFAQLRVYLLPQADTEVSRVFAGLTDPVIAAAIGVQQWGLAAVTLEEAFIRIVKDHS